MKKDVLKTFAVAKAKEEQPNEEADFEAALSATGFGKFNLLLLFVAIPSALAPMFESTTMSFVFPAAQCDLQLSLQNKGMLNAITYLGMITSGLFWGYLADTLGRKKLLIIGYFLDGLLVLCSGLSQSFEMLATFKYFGGFIINGPFAVLTSYLSELHSAKYRARVQVMMGVVFSLASILLPVVALGVFQTHIDVALFNYLKIFNWNIFLFICSLPSLIAGTCMCFMPESPKFLMSMGQNEKALEVFQKVYEMNTGNPADSYPVKKLVDEIQQGGKITANRSKVQAMKEGWQQIKPMFCAKYRCQVLLVCLIQTAVLTGANAIRLWTPQIFIAITNYQNQHGGAASSLCEMLSMVQPNVTIVNGTTRCDVDVGSISPYVNSMIVSGVCIVAYLIAGVLINAVRKKLLLMFCSAMSASFAVALFFSQGIATTVILVSIFQAAASICANLLLNITVDVFPTTLRTMTLSLVMVLGRTGALTGSLTFPLLLTVGCLPTFVVVGIQFTLALLLSLFLPKTDQKPLE